MFSPVCVNDSCPQGEVCIPACTGEGIHTPPAQCMLGYTPPPASACCDTQPDDGHCSRWYTSYWNTFYVYTCCLHLFTHIILKCFPVYIVVHICCLYIYVSLRLHVQNGGIRSTLCGKLGISLVLLNFLHCNFRLWFKTHKLSIHTLFMLQK